MSFTNNPTLPRDRIRMRVGDTDDLNEYISDDWYDYYIYSNSDNETLAAIDAAKAILAKFTGNTREKVDQVEIWGNDQFTNYLEWLKNFIENPSLSGLKSPLPYAGGISKSDMESNDLDLDNNTTPIKTGFTEKSCSDLVYDYWYLKQCK